jgi:FkbM family methyltransferase
MLKFYKYSFYKRFKRIIEIISSKYWYLIFDDVINTKYLKYNVPNLEWLEDNNNWIFCEIKGRKFYWPKFLDIKPLLGLYKETFTPEEFNPHAFEYGEVKVKNNDWVIDAGACEGFFTSKAIEKGAKVIAIEPILILVEGLKKTFNNDINEERVKIVAGILSDKEGICDFIVPQNAYYAATSNIAWAQNTKWCKSVEKFKVNSYTIDDLIKNEIMPTVDYIKIDVENDEYAVLQGAQKTLKEIKPKLAIAVYHSYENANKIREFLRLIQPKYKIKLRGLFIRNEFGKPRPFMIYAD